MSGKLIRDKAKDLENFDTNLLPHIRRVVDEDEHRVLLVEKLFEEIGELMAADTDEDLLEEWVDVYTVAMTIIRKNLPKETFYEAFEKKLAEKGGFEEGWVLDLRVLP